MKKIGLLYGDEIHFSQAVKDKLIEFNANLQVEDVKLDIVNNGSVPDYSVILDRFSYCVPFYKYAMNFYALTDIKVVNGTSIYSILDDFSILLLLKQNKIKVPKTAIIPSKLLPSNVNDNAMHNLQYPLDWDAMFDTIGFPANIKSNNSNDLFDCYRIYNKQDFFFIYDMSGTKTLLFQECIDVSHNVRIFVVNNNKIYLNYELHKAPVDRYSLFTVELNDAIQKQVDQIIKTIYTHLNLDMYLIDIAIDKQNTVYLLNINLFDLNIDNACIPKDVYDWLVSETAKMLFNETQIEVVETQKKTSKLDRAVPPSTADVSEDEITKPKRATKRRKPKE